MTLDAKSYLKAAFPPPLRMPGAVPRIFLLRFDNHKVLSKRRDKDDWHETWGTLYPEGGVTLQYGMFYRTRSEMEAAYEAMGSFKVVFLDEPEGETEA
jgi:hypothetical protein